MRLGIIRRDPRNSESSWLVMLILSALERDEAKIEERNRNGTFLTALLQVIFVLVTNLPIIARRLLANYTQRLF